MQRKTIFVRPIAAIAAAVTMMTTPVVITTAVSVVSMATPTSAHAGRRDGQVAPTAWEQFQAYISGLVLSERKQP